jgi:hypothetical protein
MKKKGDAIPTRFDAEESSLIAELSEATGIPKSEIIRRSVKYALDCARDTGSIDFLRGDNDEIASILGTGRKKQTTLRAAEDPPAGFGKPTPPDPGTPNAAATGPRFR